MTDHIADREAVLDQLRRELVGPAFDAMPEDDGARAVKYLDFEKAVEFPDVESSYKVYVQEGSGEEVLQRDRPCKRYGVGVLYPNGLALEQTDSGEIDDDELFEDSTDTNVITAAGERAIKKVYKRLSGFEPEGDDFELTGANAYQPSTMAISFLAQLPEGSKLVVNAIGGRYRRKVVRVAESERVWWLRAPVEVEASFERDQLIGNSNRLVRVPQEQADSSDPDDLLLDLTAFTRPSGDNVSLITVSLINRSPRPSRGAPDERCLFQSHFSVTVIDPHGERLCAFLPYPDKRTSVSNTTDPETDSLDLLYRKMRTFAVGHGCAADWAGPAETCVDKVLAVVLPVVETPSITPRLFVPETGPNREEITVPMGPLAGLDPGNDGFESMERVINLYEEWLNEEQRPQIVDLDQRLRIAAERHLGDCQRALTRMRVGLDFIRSGPARRAFELANEAILQQQLRTRSTPRATVIEGGRFRVPESLAVEDWKSAMGRGSWRPFQIAFLLCAVASVVDPLHDERETVELIWFPTGGGKTEAYLGLAAFALFYRRLKDPSNHGVEVLMRYTLRLLTQQQFQRASSLICAMEWIRRREEGLGDTEFSIGIWLGGSTTPNTRNEARSMLRKLNRGDDWVENGFVILRCPWCSAQMGPIDKSNIPGRSHRRTPAVAGYVEDNRSVAFRCPDSKCDFATGMPVYVVDEDVYEKRPSIVIATVDKFALLAWNENCRSLFGIGPDGERIASPPQTIIQDELHLIAGPLGSIVGLYEAIIEQLCTDERDGHSSRPKIVSSTATIRGYEGQIRSIYARNDVALFPPRALDAGDSFFARFAREENGDLSRGRQYVGVHAPGLGSTQTAQVRTFTTLLQAPQPMESAARDPWWTLMVFFNSLRELGTALSLFQSNIPDYLKVVRNRYNLALTDLRRLRRPLELTGRLSNDQIPKSMELLNQPAGEESVDICLASSIVEVGIDIERLSLMTVVGQPKSTSQYIQVTGRVGRQWWSKPALITTIYSPTRPRDRSHFEQFRSYHERLYAQVEPTSVTPFSPPVLDRALHAALVAFVRQTSPIGTPPWPVPDQAIERAYDILARRVSVVDGEEKDTLDRIFNSRREQWTRWERRIWQSSAQGDNAPLLRRAGEYATRAEAQVSWPTPNSMRHVDAECRAEVSLRYVQEGKNV